MRAKRLLLLPALVLVYVLVAEAGLQIAAFFVRRATRAELPVAWVTGNVRVLCLGDSHTYGLWVERSQAWPQQLESLWNQRIDSPKLEVLNLGVPGVNSSRLLSELPRMLAAFDPDTLIVMVGGNDFWTLPVPQGDAPPRESFLKRHSLLYRLYYLFQRGRQVRAPEIILDPDATLSGSGRYQVRVGDQHIEMGYTAGASDLKGSLASLEENLRRLVELAREGGRPLYLMTYPTRQNPFLTASMVIKAVAEQTGTPLIDLTAVFARICPQRECPETVFEDGHPKAPGYRIVAETIVERMARRGDS
jgi:lysophospholipase L1-like esterase